MSTKNQKLMDDVHAAMRHILSPLIAMNMSVILFFAARKPFPQTHLSIMRIAAVYPFYG